MIMIIIIMIIIIIINNKSLPEQSERRFFRKQFKEIKISTNSVLCILLHAHL
jgi:hypothetical protein